MLNHLIRVLILAECGSAKTSTQLSRLSSIVDMVKGEEDEGHTEDLTLLGPRTLEPPCGS